MPRRYLLRALAYPAILAAILLAMKTQDRYADISSYWEKMEEVREVQPEVLFLGSSRTLRHIDPVRIDSLRADGVTSYNFGVPGSRSLETHFRADHLLKMDDLNVRRMVVEMAPIDIAIPERARGTRRVQHYHDARRAMIGTRVAMASDRPFLRRVRPAANRWRFWTTNTFLVGWGREWVNAVLTERRSESGKGRVRPVGRRGYIALVDDGSEDRSTRREAFLSPEGQREFDRRIALIRDRANAVPTERDRVTADAWIRLAERARQRGVEVVFVEQVGTEQGAGVTKLVREALGDDAVIVLNDPERYPELFDRDAWFDVGHLGQAMALRSTDIVAAELPPFPGATPPRPIPDALADTTASRPDSTPAPATR